MLVGAVDHESQQGKYQMRFQLLNDIIINGSNRHTLLDQGLGEILTLFVLATENSNIARTDGMEFMGIFVLNINSTRKKLFDSCSDFLGKNLIWMISGIAVPMGKWWWELIRVISLRMQPNIFFNNHILESPNKTAVNQFYQVMSWSPGFVESVFDQMRGIISFWKQLGGFFHQFHIGTTKSIDALFGVAHPITLLHQVGEQLEYLQLDRTWVLELVDHHQFVGTLYFFCDFRLL